MLKLPKLPDRVPIKLTVLISPDLQHALSDYAALYAQAYGQQEAVSELVPAILEAYLGSDRGFARARRRPTPQVKKRGLP